MEQNLGPHDQSRSTPQGVKVEGRGKMGKIASPTPTNEVKDEEDTVNNPTPVEMNDYPVSGHVKEQALWIAWKIYDAKRLIISRPRLGKSKLPNGSGDHAPNSFSEADSSEEATQTSVIRLMHEDASKVYVPWASYTMLSPGFAKAHFPESGEQSSAQTSTIHLLCAVLAVLAVEIPDDEDQKNADQLSRLLESGNVSSVADAIKTLSKNRLVARTISKLLRETGTLSKGISKPAPKYEGNKLRVDVQKRNKQDRSLSKTFLRMSEVPQGRPITPPEQTVKINGTAWKTESSAPPTEKKGRSEHTFDQPSKRRALRQSTDDQFSTSYADRGLTTPVLSTHSSSSRKSSSRSLRSSTDTIRVGSKPQKTPESVSASVNSSPIHNTSPIGVPSSITSFESNASVGPLESGNGLSKDQNDLQVLEKPSSLQKRMAHAVNVNVPGLLVDEENWTFDETFPSFKSPSESAKDVLPIHQRMVEPSAERETDDETMIRASKRQRKPTERIMEATEADPSIRSPIRALVRPEATLDPIDTKPGPKSGGLQTGAPLLRLKLKRRESVTPLSESEKTRNVSLEPLSNGQGNPVGKTALVERRGVQDDIIDEHPRSHRKMDKNSDRSPSKSSLIVKLRLPNAATVSAQTHSDPYLALSRFEQNLVDQLLELCNKAASSK